MKKCCICGKELTDENALLLCIDEQGTCKDLCETCWEQMQAIETFEYEDAVKKAIQYFYQKMDTIQDADVKNYVREIVEAHAHYLDTDVKTQIFLGLPKRRAEDSIWISGLRTCIIALFVLIIIGGFILSVSVGSEVNGAAGFLVFVLTMIIAFLSVAWGMVFLDMASDIAIIRKRAQMEK